MSKNLTKMFYSSEELASECWIISRGPLVGDDKGGVIGALVDVETSISPKSIISSFFFSESKVDQALAFYVAR